jgi:hypothetical protein
MFDFLGALAKLSSIFSAGHLTHQRRRKIAKALVQLHENLDEVLANAHRILKKKPDDLGILRVDASIVERQVAALLEAQRLLSTAPLRNVLRIKWKPLPKFRAINEGKGSALVLALAAFYHLRPKAKAEAEIQSYSLKQFREQNPGNDEYLGPYDPDQASSLVPFEEGLREVHDGATMVVLATPQHYREAKQRVAELAIIAKDLRKFISLEFKPEELS